MAHVSEAQLSRELAALREKHRFYQMYSRTTSAASEKPAVQPTKRPQSAAKSLHRSTAMSSRADEAAREAGEARIPPGHPASTTTSDAQPPATVQEPASRGRIRPRSVHASKRKSSVTHGTQLPRVLSGACGNEQLSDGLLRAHEARKRQEDRMFARELVGEMRTIATEYLAMVKDANRYAYILGIPRSFSLCDQQSFVETQGDGKLKPNRLPRSARFDESKVLFSSKLLVKVDHNDGSQSRYLSLDGFTREYEELKSKLERRLVTLPTSEAEAIMKQSTTLHHTLPRSSSALSQGEGPNRHSGSIATANADDDAALEAGLQQLLEDTKTRKQQIDHQLDVLKQLEWNVLR